MPDDLSPFLTDKMVATFLRCSRGTVWRLTADGVLPPPVRIAGMTRWRRADIAALAEREGEAA
jgi:predicted DNA-binding transcriptional regulator AlpA